MLNVHRFTSPSADLSSANYWLRKFAFFEGDGAPAPSPAPQPPVTTPPDTNGGDGHEDEKPIMNSDQLKERLERARLAAYEKFKKDFGIEDDAADKERLKKAREQEEANRTEVEKAAKRAESAEASANDWKSKYEAEVSKNRLERLDSAILAELRGQQAKDAELSLIGLKARKAKDVDALLNDEGVVDAKKLTDVIGALKKDFPDQFGLKSGVPGTGSHSGGSRPDPNRDGKDKARQDLRSTIRRSF